MSPKRKAWAWGGAALAMLAMAAGAVRPAQQTASAAVQTQTMAGSQRHRELAGETAQLLKAAKVLKAEVDKTNKDTLSLGVIRRAEEVEKMARGMRERHGAAR